MYVECVIISDKHTARQKKRSNVFTIICRYFGARPQQNYAHAEFQ